MQRSTLKRGLHAVICLGAQNHGAQNVTNGGMVDSLYADIGACGGIGVAAVNGAGSIWATRGDMT